MGSSQFSLKAAICHIGENRESGHYQSVCFRNSSYVLFDDAKDIVNNQNSVNAALRRAYIIFYEKDEVRDEVR